MAWHRSGGAKRNLSPEGKTQVSAHHVRLLEGIQVKMLTLPFIYSQIFKWLLCSTYQVWHSLGSEQLEIQTESLLIKHL